MSGDWQKYIEDYHSNWKDLFQHTGSSEKTPKSDNNQHSELHLFQSYPKIDLYQEENNLIVEAELPSMTKQDIHVFIENRSLILRGSFKSLKPKIHYIIKERHHFEFERRIPLPNKINEKQIVSTFQKGILKLVLPISKEDEERVEIPISKLDH